MELNFEFTITPTIQNKILEIEKKFNVSGLQLQLINTMKQFGIIAMLRGVELSKAEIAHINKIIKTGRKLDNLLRDSSDHVKKIIRLKSTLNFETRLSNEISVYSHLIESRKGAPQDRIISKMLVNELLIYYYSHPDKKWKKPIWNGRKYIHLGDIYDFICSIENILGQLGVRLGEDGSLGADRGIGETIIEIMNELEQRNIKLCNET